MDENTNLDNPTISLFNFFLTQIASVFITAVFLVIWVVIQYGVNRLLEWLQPTGIDQIVLWTFQGVFAVTTLFPVLMYYYVDARVIWIRGQRRVTQEKRGG